MEKLTKNSKQPTKRQRKALFRHKSDVKQTFVLVQSSLTYTITHKQFLKNSRPLTQLTEILKFTTTHKNLAQKLNFPRHSE